MFTPNMNAGMFFHTEKFYMGLSAFNLVGKSILVRKDIALGFHDFHYFFTMGGLLELSGTVDFMPSILVREVKGAPTSLDLNMMFRLSDLLMVGTSYRSSYAMGKSNLVENSLRPPTSLSLIFEVFATDNFRFGYAYDTNLNGVDNFAANSHEFSLGFYLFRTQAYEIQRRKF